MIEEQPSEELQNLPVKSSKAEGPELEHTNSGSLPFKKRQLLPINSRNLLANLVHKNEQLLEHALVEPDKAASAAIQTQQDEVPEQGATDLPIESMHNYASTKEQEPALSWRRPRRRSIQYKYIHNRRKRAQAVMLRKKRIRTTLLSIFCCLLVTLISSGLGETFSYYQSLLPRNLHEGFSTCLSKPNCLSLAFRRVRFLHFCHDPDPPLIRVYSKVLPFHHIGGGSNPAGSPRNGMVSVKAVL